MSLDLQEQYEKIYTFIYFKVYNQEVAEDITQETFLKYFDTTGYLEKGKKLAFLYTIARNCCIDYARKTKHITTDTLPELPDTTASAVSMDIEMAFDVQAAVAKLPAQDQEIVLLRFTNDLGIQEIAEYLSISRFAVYRKLNAIKKQLKAALAHGEQPRTTSQPNTSSQLNDSRACSGAHQHKEETL